MPLSWPLFLLAGLVGLCGRQHVAYAAAVTGAFLAQAAEQILPRVQPVQGPVRGAPGFFGLAQLAAQRFNLLFDRRNFGLDAADARVRLPCLGFGCAQCLFGRGRFLLRLFQRRRVLCQLGLQGHAPFAHLREAAGGIRLLVLLAPQETACGVQVLDQGLPRFLALAHLCLQRISRPLSFGLQHLGFGDGCLQLGDTSRQRLLLAVQGRQLALGILLAGVQLPQPLLRHGQLAADGLGAAVQARARRRAGRPGRRAAGAGCCARCQCGW